jgi:hypothetical protein
MKLVSTSKKTSNMSALSCCIAPLQKSQMQQLLDNAAAAGQCEYEVQGYILLRPLVIKAQLRQFDPKAEQFFSLEVR